MMRDHRAGERAQAELEKQLVELSGLRNATTRDSGFKLWRQTTLTLLQRTWEGDDSRAERFRRVPFSPPSARADREELREWYERGCAEAAALLRDLIDDVAQHGVVRTRFETLEDDAAAALDALPEDSAPMLTLGGEEPPKPATPAQRPTSGIARLPEPAPPPPPRPAAPRKESGRPGRSQRASKKMNLKMRLKDMLGFADPEAAAADENVRESSKQPPAAPPPTLAQTPAAPAPPARRASPPPTAIPPVPAATARPADTALPVTRGAAALPSIPAPPEFQLPPDEIDETAHLAPHDEDEDLELEDEPAGRPAEHPMFDEGTLQRALEAALHSFVAREPAPREPEATPAPAAEMISQSPVFDPKARPARRKNGGQAADVAFLTPTAIAVSVIANEVGSLGVPDRYRAITRAAMLDLAGHLERHDLTWQTLREAVHFVMEYPMLARRVLPLLLPYLDRAA